MRKLLETAARAGWVVLGSAVTAAAVLREASAEGVSGVRELLQLPARAAALEEELKSTHDGLLESMRRSNGYLDEVMEESARADKAEAVLAVLEKAGHKDLVDKARLAVEAQGGLAQRMKAVLDGGRG